MAKITTALAKQLIANFKDKKIGTPYNEAERGVWIERKTLEECLADVDGQGVSGIRFYFGAYGDFTPGNPPPYREYEANKVTLVLVPTSETLVNDPKTGIEYHPDMLDNLTLSPEENNLQEVAGNDGQISPPPPPPEE
ncbi:MAG: hypothetical protein ABIT96_13935 [Ferruginibacter sp.]